MIDNGFDSAATASVILGNAGAGNITENVIVRIYEGDAESDEALLMEIIYSDGFNSGDFDTVVIDGIDPSTITSGNITVVAEIEGGFSECSQENNVQTIPVLSTTGLIELSLDSDRYAINSDINLTSEVTNNGAILGNYEIVTEIRDTEGTPVFIFDAQSVSDLASGGINELNNVWNTGLTIAGQYLAISSSVSYTHLTLPTIYSV